ncbi:hypothetical protein PVAND_004441 [Polypedilum vanderplanki]|uniref:Ig-like domain-containing protein n=1 Tax=Polypedilum vanderplanki TaxID=319348 RepID=A0A9J6BXQ7_POLVA|nr:hypothetical protein PVAND_004441 [Polypedilum vanderplanki]
MIRKFNTKCKQKTKIRKVFSRIFQILKMIIITILNYFKDISVGLRDVRVTIPAAVKRGDNALLICNYDMEGDSLYSIKWYKGKREFYRYTPKETQSIIKTFPVAGINVETNLSNASQVVISQVDTNISGKFSCEVSADAPHFNTMIVSGEMNVVEIPEAKPVIDGIMARYRPGDELRGNCSSQYSKPAANLTWMVNDVPASPSQMIFYKLSKNDSNLESTILGIHFSITQQHFIRGKLKLKCIAQIHEIYHQSDERLIEEVRPKILATGTSNMNMYHSINEGELSNPNVGMTQYKANKLKHSNKQQSQVRVTPPQRQSQQQQTSPLTPLRGLRFNGSAAPGD